MVARGLAAAAVGDNGDSITAEGPAAAAAAHWLSTGLLSLEDAEGEKDNRGGRDDAANGGVGDGEWVRGGGVGGGGEDDDTSGGCE